MIVRAFLDGLRAECRDLAYRILFPDFSAYRVQGADVAVALGLFAACFALYAVLALRLAQGDFLYYYNYGFDLDPARYVAIIAGDPSLYDVTFVKGGPKHPLMTLLRPVAWPFEAAGFDVRASASLAKALFGAGTVALVYGFFRLARLPLAEALSLAVLFAVTSSQLFNAFIIDSYGFALFFIVFVWCLAAARQSDPDRFPLLRVAVTVLNIGTTFTNGIQSAAAELIVWYRRLGLVGGAMRVLAFLAVVGVVFAVMVVVVWNAKLLDVLADPIESIKYVYWQNPKGEKTGLGPILLSFFGHSFVSPQFTVIPLPEGVAMHDFRGFYTSALGQVTFALWIAFLAAATAAGVWQRQTRPLVLALLAIIAFNHLFHLSYQYRESLYLYAAHAHFPIFALLLGAGAWCCRRTVVWRAVFVGGVLLLAVLMAAINLDRAFWFASAFDQLDPPTPRLLLED